MPGIVIEQRRLILDEQVAAFGGYHGAADRLTGLWRELFRAQPQYYEAPYWRDYPGVRQEIADYEASGLAGWKAGALSTAVRFSLAVTGFGLMLWVLIRGQGAARRVALVLACWSIGLVALALLTVPLGWQRYYLPLQPPLAVIMGLGSGVGLQALGSWGRKPAGDA
jgi:hypothetical protein